jgi:hypothetical protein
MRAANDAVWGGGSGDPADHTRRNDGIPGAIYQKCRPEGAGPQPRDQPHALCHAHGAWGRGAPSPIPLRGLPPTGRLSTNLITEYI